MSIHEIIEGCGAVGAFFPLRISFVLAPCQPYYSLQRQWKHSFTFPGVVLAHHTVCALYIYLLCDNINWQQVTTFAGGTPKMSVCEIRLTFHNKVHPQNHKKYEASTSVDKLNK